VTALQRVTDIDSLRQAWKNLLDHTPSRHRSTSGIDGESVRQFADNLDRNLRQLSYDLRSGGFHYNRLKVHFEEKSTGGLRLICVPTVRDRIVQRAVLEYLHRLPNPRYRLENEISYGFIKGRTVNQAVERAIALRNSFPWVYKTDISKFFDTLPRPTLKSEVTGFIRLRSLHPLLLEAIDCEIEPRDKIQKEKLSRTHLKVGVGVRQGMPLSPYFANLLLRSFDADIQKRGFHVVRYADDLIFLASSEEECRNIHEFCKTSLAVIGLSIPDVGDKKTHIWSPTESAEFLGVGLELDGKARYVVNLTEHQMAGKRERLLELTDNKTIHSNKLTLPIILRRIDGRVNGWLGCYDYVNNIDVFEQRLSDWRKLALEKLFAEQLGLTDLNKARRCFLGIEPYSQ
jgi:RNA-directed DNA polymerase